jgi:hypothetical protein
MGLRNKVLVGRERQNERHRIKEKLRGIRRECGRRAPDTPLGVDAAQEPASFSGMFPETIVLKLVFAYPGLKVPQGLPCLKGDRMGLRNKGLVAREQRNERHRIKEKLRRIWRAYGRRNQGTLHREGQTAGRACEAQIEADELVCKISETMMVNEIVKKIEEMSGDRQQWNN